MVLNEGERNLIACIGVYGIWLLRNTMGLSHRQAKPIKEAYNTWLKHDGEIAKAKPLIEAIDHLCSTEPTVPKVGTDYQSALEELILFKGGLVSRLKI